MPEIVLESRSASERFALHLRAKPGAYDRDAVAALLSIAPGAVDKALQPGVEAAVITIANDADLGRVWRAGPRLAEWKLAPSPAAEKAQAEAAPKPAAKTRRGGPRMSLPPLNVEKLAVSAVMPLPQPLISRRGESRHDKLLNTLTADGMSVTGIPIAYQPSLLKAVQTYLDGRPALKATSALYVRRMEGSEELIGIWRVARNGADASPRTRPVAVKAA
jgi:hypothetical protein